MTTLKFTKSVILIIDFHVETIKQNAFKVSDAFVMFFNALQSDSSAAHVAVVPPKAVSSAEAANQWLQSAHAEVSGSQSANTPLAVIISSLLAVHNGFMLFLYIIIMMSESIY